MKTFLVGTVFVTLCMLMTGCEIVGPRIKVEEPKIKIPVVSVEVEGSKKHCPPGLAKQGRC